ncbi:peptide chain release factor N(5)-glutamine methyltransferase [Paracoccus xiamenensis]|uniref:peptide chain release factor N(5)-glutamine methyltransferase n=1 Tax=Paracoccus xiamenensis TaxID=2714901 RepID=UPI00140B7C39|nr:peptide chain release factor N(5)-glutamine methyltransferase [Paracoccus xiamenensis]NHF74291.1 peptide chain release factor N(5)-glutamine methyltransferase [Paracoccus xiamenensis]
MIWQDWLAGASARLAEAGLDDPRREAWALISGLIGSNARHRIVLGAPMPEDQRAALDEMLAARAARQPLSQIIGRRAFWKHDFAVTRDTLDPRPETEALVEAALKLPWSSVLDLGTGTGAILISLLAERPGAQGLGTDMSEPALAVARDNAAQIGVDAAFKRADWFQGVTGTFDLIVSNPPYIALSEMPDLSPEVRDWEPHSALTDFGDGLSAYRAIAAGAVAHLAPGGHVLVEIGWQQGRDVAAIFSAVGAEVAVLPDLGGRDRVVRAHFGANPG